MTLRQRSILEGLLKNTSLRLDHVHYMRGGNSSKDDLFIEYVQFRNDGSGVRIRRVWNDGGYPTHTTQEELITT
jgi:hypothetical protein